MIDFHTHILPAIDDGSRDLEESLEILRQEQALGIKTVMATPHFYPDDTIEAFVARRDKAYAELKEAAHKEGLVETKIHTGAEVLISVDTWKLEGLEALCLEGTNYILIELPYSHWSDWVFASVQAIIENRKLIPIMAHVERYSAIKENPNHLLRLIEMGALIQVNAYSLLKGSSREKLVHKLISHHMIHLLGSDVHRAKGLTSVKEGYHLIEEKHGKGCVQAMLQMGDRVCCGQKVEIMQPKRLRKLFNKWF